jgi:MoaA/NifB/PqqE/SkfB family radical SAM enzyme
MTHWISSIRKRFAPVEKLPPGFYHYVAPAEEPLHYRLHLRLESDGSGVLIVNASTVLHLNQTAAEYTYHLVVGTPRIEIAQTMAARYRVSPQKALEDFQDLKSQIDTLINTPDLDPVMFLDFDRRAPYLEDISAPFRLDCALTYRLPEKAPPGAAPTKRVDRELSTNEWKSIIDKAWQAGIPHILLTGGEPTLREDLVDIVQYAEDHGQVTGLLTDGIKLADANYLNSILQAGLDHILIVLQPDEEKTWDSLANFSYWTDTLDEDIFVTAHLTITKKNVSHIKNLLDRLSDAGVSAVSLSESDPTLREALQDARTYADDLDLDLVWDLPVPYSNMNPVSLEIEEDIESRSAGAGKGWLYVEPDGDVLPAQGINKVLGNLLNNPWESIWEKAKKI